MVQETRVWLLPWQSEWWTQMCWFSGGVNNKIQSNFLLRNRTISTSLVSQTLIDSTIICDNSEVGVSHGLINYLIDAACCIVADITFKTNTHITLSWGFSILYSNIKVSCTDLTRKRSRGTHITVVYTCKLRTPLPSLLLNTIDTPL